MSDNPFDPHLEWLGLDISSEPLDHYRLLGLNRGEGDPGKIRRVAQARINLVRQQDPGAHREDWKKLLLALQDAGRCLLDRERKTAYDAQLKSRLEKARPSDQTQRQTASLTGSQSKQTPTAIPMAIPIATPVSSDNVPTAFATVAQIRSLPTNSETAPSASPASAPSVGGDKSSGPTIKTFTPSVATRQRFRQQQNKKLALITLVTLIVIGVCAWAGSGHVQSFLASLSESQSSETNPTKVDPAPESTSPAESKEDENTSFEFGHSVPMKELSTDKLPSDPTKEKQNAAPVDSSSMTEAVSASASESPENRPDDSEAHAIAMPASESRTDSPPPSPPENTAQVDKHLSDAFLAMRKRQQSAADELLAKCSEIALQPDTKKRVESMRTLHKALSQFWNAVEKCMGSIKAGDEIVVGSTPALVVDSSSDSIKIRFLGRNREYARADLPSGLAIALASQRLNEDSGQSKIILGAFRLVDREGDVEAARELWNEAANSGEEVALLLPLLDFAASQANATEAAAKGDLP